MGNARAAVGAEAEMKVWDQRGRVGGSEGLAFTLGKMSALGDPEQSSDSRYSSHR